MTMMILEITLGKKKTTKKRADAHCDYCQYRVILFHWYIK